MPVCGGLCIPDVSKPLAEIASEFICLEALKVEGNLQHIQDISHNIIACSFIGQKSNKNLQTLIDIHKTKNVQVKRSIS